MFRKWKVYFYFQNVCIGKKKIEEAENPFQNNYVIRVLNKKYMFKTNYFKSIVKPIKLKKTDEDKRQIHVEVEFEKGVEI